MRRRRKRGQEFLHFSNEVLTGQVRIFGSAGDSRAGLKRVLMHIAGRPYGKRVTDIQKTRAPSRLRGET